VLQEGGQKQIVLVLLRGVEDMTPLPDTKYIITEEQIRKVEMHVESKAFWDSVRASLPVSSCTWKLDDEYGMYETGCGNAFECIEGDIEENNFKFCPYCGGRIKEIVEGAP